MSSSYAGVPHFHPIQPPHLHKNAWGSPHLSSNFSVPPHPNPGIALGSTFSNTKTWGASPCNTGSPISIHHLNLSSFPPLSPPQSHFHTPLQHPTTPTPPQLYYTTPPNPYSLSTAPRSPLTPQVPPTHPRQPPPRLDLPDTTVVARHRPRGPESPPSNRYAGDWSVCGHQLGGGYEEVTTGDNDSRAAHRRTLFVADFGLGDDPEAPFGPRLNLKDFDALILDLERELAKQINVCL